MAADRRMWVRGTAALALVLASVVLSAPGAWAGDGVQFSRDCTSTYVNKQVGENEQWAITYSVFGDATGNVLKLDGSAPSFIECRVVGGDETSELFTCYGSDACTSPPCGGTQWQLVAENLAIPLSFFFPTGVDPQNSFEECVPAS